MTNEAITEIIVLGVISCLVVWWLVSLRRREPSVRQPEVDRIPEDMSADAKAVLKLLGHFMRFSLNPEWLCNVLDMNQCRELGIQLPDNLEPRKKAGWACQLSMESSADPVGLGRELSNCLGSGKNEALVVFCMRMMLVEDKVKRGQMALLEGMARGMELDKERYRQMLHKSVPVERLEEDEELYSIYLGMEGMDDDEEKKMHLTRLYMKWNPVSTNFDPMKSGRAKSLLGLIKAFRAKLEK